nr:putative reverse transcriptase domain-containing protein [Tanacetum cinerariifolium]
MQCRAYLEDISHDHDDPHNDAHPEGQNSTKRQKTSEHGTFEFRESSSGQDYESEPASSTSGNQDQSNDFDFWTNSYAIYDDVLPNEKVSQELMDEMSQTVYEAKLRKFVDEMLRQHCTSGDEHQYHIDQMQNFLKSDIKGNTGPEKIALSLHKFPAIRFPNNDIEERTSKWVRKCVKKFNPYARYGVKHWKNSHAKIFYKETTRTQKAQERSVESYQQQVNLTAPTITFPSIKKYKVFSIIFKPMYGIIYKNSKKEKKVMTHQEVHKFCDATIKRVLEGLKSYNNDVKYGYVTHNLSKEDDEYLQLFSKEIEERLKPFKFLAKVGTVAYQLELPKQLSRVHSTFHVLNLKKCLSDENLAIPLDEIQIYDKLHFIEEPVKIIDREVKRLKQSHILIFKVCWNSRRGHDFTWEREDQMQKKYPRLFANSAPMADVTS